MEDERKTKRLFTPEQKMHIVQAVDADIKNGLNTTQAVEKAGVCYSNFRKWKAQLAVGVNSSLRNGKIPVDKDKKRLERENEKLKAVILSQSQMIAFLHCRNSTSPQSFQVQLLSMVMRFSGGQRIEEGLPPEGSLRHGEGMLIT